MESLKKNQNDLFCSDVRVERLDCATIKLDCEMALKDVSQDLIERIRACQTPPTETTNPLSGKNPEIGFSACCV